MHLGLIFLAFLTTLAGVATFRRLAARTSRLLDIPNERSSHTAPVTRGAGISIVLSSLALYIGAFGNAINLSFIIASLAIAAVSFLDDLFSIPILIRLTVHFLAAGLFVFYSGYYPQLLGPWSETGLDLGTTAPWLTIVFIVWTINAFNFMDGIDGIAGIQGLAAGLGWLILGITSGIQSYSSLGSILAGACAGFLVFNWHPAKVFMGDVGSTFLGFTFAVLPLIDTSHFSNLQPYALAATIVFLWLFMFDTVFTRILQVLLLRPFWKPHRDHLYQKLVVSGVSHQAVAVFFGFIALTAACSFSFLGILGAIPITLVLFISPAWLLAWAWKKRLT